MNIALVYLGTTEYHFAAIHNGVCGIHTQYVQCLFNVDNYFRIEVNFVLMKVNLNYSLGRSLETASSLTYLDSLL